MKSDQLSSNILNLYANILVEDTSHLETKRQLSDLRSQYGDAWLHSQGGSLVQHVLGMTALVANKSQTESNSNDKGLSDASEFNKPLLSSTPKNDDTADVSAIYIKYINLCKNKYMFNVIEK